MCSVFKLFAVYKSVMHACGMFAAAEEIEGEIKMSNLSGSPGVNVADEETRKALLPVRVLYRAPRKKP